MKKLSHLAVILLLGLCTNAGAADPALGPPPVNTTPGPGYADNTRIFQGIPGIERAASGRLWALWYAGGPDEPGEGPGNYVVLVTSSDDGKNWSGPKLVIDPPGPVRAYDPCLWHDPQGRLWLFWAQSYKWWDGRSGVWAIVTDNPADENPKWSAPRRICDGIMMNKPTALTTGEWLLPASVWPGKPKIDPEFSHDLGSRIGANVMISANRGETWAYQGQALVPQRVFDEHSIIQRRDGTLWMLVRAAYGIGESISTDLGKTWSEGRRSDIPHVNSRFFICRLRSGKLVLVTHNPPDGKTRSHLTARLSDDDGKTWTGGLVIDERQGVSYPDGFQAPDGSIYVIYDFERTNAKEILMAKFREEDILAGKFQSADSKAQVLVNKAGNSAMAKQAAEDAKSDRTTIIFDGKSPDKMVCDTTLRELPNGTWIHFMLAGGDTEPSPRNYTGVSRSSDQGKTWSPLETFDTTFPRTGKTIGQGPTELMVHEGRCTLFFSTHARHWSDQWQSWFMTSDDSSKTWSKPEQVPGRLQNRTFIRNHIIARDGRIILPFQHYIGPDAEQNKAPLDRKFTNPRNGVIMSSDGGKTWTEHGNIRLTTNDHYFGWAENNIAEFSDGRIVMIIRADGLGGVLYSAESKDGGKTWPEFAGKTDIPNPGSKATLYPLGGEAVALLHNPNPKQRTPLALWVSFDGMKTWPYQRVLVPESCDGPKGRMNYPDGFVSRDKQFLHFAFDDNRHRAVYYGAKLPPVTK